ncbi:tRNA-i(6)A37 thiotransferase enzyme MiaB [Halanaerobium saccharolyticum]|uniref:tRNA-2-methylthio-N(6)-dimethylallyladenosine synthase n=1 Tax=Halanaerobium saccharolyticum TaxID=43595 RepID=A0A4R7Z8I3_9FIRM|nr:tRNA (N6-isopentenyl adenosine(37)-C2)-methylthiotransferase MiaB [Halanaerobium saccharolyticum]RAK11199.1 tRNA-i(6)A37 thiotransferase enzyme MiaB [Halanaerobium saccharolyticum]TDW07050.1 tRNA-i(6)A37 thiotransferase enzyme MiaB [Halanaerobium saccharolyticum]TDX63815.1 tRNA-i(6)A37 thiotransferase enzyme MiaB [Halanaerobium saccharolyticum]
MSENKFYNIITYGCQMNEHDSERLAGMLEEMGYQQTEELGSADIILLNTCIIRENAELKVFGKLGELKRYKRENPDLIIGIGGCMMQQDEPVDEVYKKYRHVDLIFGTHNIHHLPNLIKKIEETRDRVVEVWDEEEGLIPDLPSQRESEHSAWISIIQGCDNFCTYCIVPYVRGRERSRSVKSIVEEAVRLAEDGVKEITLLGQNVNSYGNDLEKEITFPKLLEELNKVEELKRIRFMTSHPRDLSDDLLAKIKNLDKVANHIHLPVQSGSNKVLKEMNRGYTREYYIDRVKKIQQEIPGAAVSTDFIVGFPGESEEDFEKTIELVKELKFDMAYTFIYSPRSGTPAARRDDQIAEAVKKGRLNRLMELQNKISYDQNQKLIGSIQKILVTGPSNNDPEVFEGRTSTNKICFIDKREDLVGEVVKVKIEDAKSWTLEGTVIE